MNMDERFVQVISEQLGVPAEAVAPDIPLMGPELKADDLDMVELTMAAEGLFGGEVSEEAVEAWFGVEFCQAQKQLTPRLLQELATGSEAGDGRDAGMGEGDADVDLAEAFSRTYGVELFLASKPEIDHEKLHAAMRAHCGNVEVGDPEPDAGMVGFFFLDHVVSYTDGEAPAQFIIMFPDAGKEQQGDYSSSLQQSWTWPDAQAALESCQYDFLATDMMASGLPYKERLAVFRNALRALLETVPCRAIHFPITDQFLAPEQFLASFDAAEPDSLCGAINVRFFNVEGSDDMLMDTVGLAAIGLCDLQCHFRSLEPQDVARMLHNTAHYVYENGDVIEDGHTIQGITPDDRWGCQHEAALVPPARVVLDIAPCPPYAAGGR
jgi:acyl carrier protein